MIYFLTDIDDTIMQTALKMDPTSKRHASAVDATGNDLSYMTNSQKKLIELYQANAVVIPVTGRSSWAMDRVSLEFTSLKIVSHGAVILGVDNKPIPSWMENIEEDVKKSKAFLEHCFDECEKAIESNKLMVEIRKLEDHGVCVYISFKGVRGSSQSSSDLSILESILMDLCEPKRGGWRVHRNGRNMALLPPYTCKLGACEWLIEHLPYDKDKDLIVTAGDSISDLPFMQAGQIMMIPTNSQIADMKLG